MAKLRIHQKIVNDNYTYTFSFDPESISDDDLARVKKFGAPSINFGGTFSQTPITFTMPDVFYDFPNDFPVTQTFSGTNPFDTGVADNLNLYRTTMVTRITEAITALRATNDTFTNEFIEQV